MGKTALITGATSGIGEATARLLAEEGYDLILTGRRSQRLRALKKELEKGFRIEVLPLSFDVRDRQQCEAELGSLPEGFREIDLLVNNAGLAAGLEHIDKGDPNDWDAMVDTNVKGLLYITRIVSGMMVRQGRGHIVNIGSTAGTQPYENGAVYCATKHAVHALSQAMRADLLRSGIKVTEIRPGMVETEFSVVRFHGDRERAGDVYRGIVPLTGEDVAEAVVWAVSQPAHVNVDEIVITASQQAGAYYTYRKEE
ncbi:SDR family NAD(P)-dependent oxidoreductase [Gallalistipes aquisgranensis]|uniref:SDR family NAD(P)-dependent oxidoreductase n=1 Tax=Gallalistipes aquisgranensis TaxID=2779358 RepID=UPI001CF898CF|nr:SDR family NAD(P)-dependent oxidoreductase [Gallalistipes aquisgranensis]MBE5034605.1 SDR family NAD(P)-dependent oxidoreductase [Gallalistipes aquisgranensis]